MLEKGLNLLFSEGGSSQGYNTCPLPHLVMSFDFIVVRGVKHHRSIGYAVNKPSLLVSRVDRIGLLDHFFALRVRLLGRLLAR